MARVRQGAFTCVGWQVTLCDPTWQVTCRSSEVGFPQEELYRSLPFYIFTSRLPSYLKQTLKIGYCSSAAYLSQTRGSIPAALYNLGNGG